MNTANRVKHIIEQDYDAASYSFVLEQYADEVDQDWENETTIYTFSDGSMMRDTNGVLEIAA